MKRKRQDDSIAPTTTPIVGLSGITTISGSVTRTSTVDNQTSNPMSIESSIFSTTPTAQPSSTLSITSPTDPTISSAVQDFFSNKGAVAGVFTGLASLMVLLCSVLTMAWRRRRRREKRQEEFEEKGVIKRGKPGDDEENVLEIKSIEGGFVRHVSDLSLDRIHQSVHGPPIHKVDNFDDNNNYETIPRGGGRGGVRSKKKRESAVVFASDPDSLLVRSYDNHPFSSPSARSSISHSGTTNAHGNVASTVPAVSPPLVIVPAFMSALPRPTPLSPSTATPFPLINDGDSVNMMVPIVLHSDSRMGDDIEAMTTRSKSLRASKGKGKGKGRATGWRKSYTSTSSWISGHVNNNSDSKRDSKASKHRSTNTTTTSGTTNSIRTKNTTSATMTSSDKRSSGEREWWWTRRRRRAAGHRVMDDWDMFRDPQEEEEERRRRKEEKRRRREERKKKQEEKKKIWNEPLMKLEYMNVRGMEKEGDTLNSWYDEDEKQASPSFLHVEHHQPVLSNLVVPTISTSPVPPYSDRRLDSNLGDGGAIWLMGENLLGIDDEKLTRGTGEPKEGRREIEDKERLVEGDLHVVDEDVRSSHGTHQVRPNRLGSLPVLPLLSFQGGDIATAVPTRNGNDDSHQKEESRPQGNDQNQGIQGHGGDLIDVSKGTRTSRNKQQQTATKKQGTKEETLEAKSTVPIPGNSTLVMTNGVLSTPFNSPPDDEELALADVFTHPYSRSYNGIYSSQVVPSSSRAIDLTVMSMDHSKLWEPNGGTERTKEKNRHRRRLTQETNIALVSNSPPHRHRPQVSQPHDAHSNPSRLLPAPYSGLHATGALEPTHRKGTVQTEQKLRTISPNAHLISSSVAPEMPTVMGPHNGRRHPYAAQS